MRVTDLIAIKTQARRQKSQAIWRGAVQRYVHFVQRGLQRGEGGVDLWQINYEDRDKEQVEQVDSDELWNILLERPNFPAAGQP